MVGGYQAPGSRHILNNHRRLPWDVLSQMAANSPRIKVVAASGCKTNDYADCLALIKGRRGMHAYGKNKDQNSCHNQAKMVTSPHYTLLFFRQYRVTCAATECTF
jgi:hypothetical protein